jgi:hypothetical protein
MIIKSKKDHPEIKKGAIGFCSNMPRFRVLLKEGLSKNKLKEMIRLVGPQAKEFFDIEDFKFRAHFYRGDVKDLPEGSLAVFDLKSLANFNVVDEENLTNKDRFKIKEIEKEQHE